MKNALAILALAYLLNYNSLQAQSIESLAQEKAWSWTGSVGANTNVYSVMGQPSRSNPFFWNVHAQFTGKIYGFELPFYFSYGQHNLSFNRPFLQTGISPTYKWIKLHLGTRNMFFSPYTLAGHTFTGAGVELTPGKWRFAAMKGTFRRARTFDEDLDPRFFNYLYRRTGHAFKLGYGTTERFIDLSYLNAQDDPSSIDFKLPEGQATPSANHVMGLSAAFKINKYLSIFGDGAISIFTRNIESIPSEDKPTPGLARLFNLTISSRVNYAFKAGLDFKLKKLRLRSSYERIMPEFETMGAFFFVNDRENFTLTPSISIFKSRVNINGNIGLQRNNLLKNRSETTSRLIGSVNINYFHPEGFGVNLNYTNFSTEQVQAAIALSDSVRLALVTSNISLTPSYTWVNEKASHSIVLSLNQQDVNDRNPFTREFTNMNTSFINANHSLQFLENGWGLSSGLNYNIISLPTFSSTRYGATIGTSKMMLENKLNFSVQSTYNASLIEGKQDGAIITINSNLGWSFQTRNSLSGFVNIILNQSKTFDNYTEVLAGVSYSYRFR